MMNLLAIGLITTSLAIAGVLSPTPQKTSNGGDHVIVKNGHRAVIVEYADAASDGNTRVSISPQPAKPDPIEEQLSRAAASIAGVAQDAKGKAHEALSGHIGPHGPSPRELICDAYGNCKEKVVGVVGKAKEEVKEVVGGAVDKAKDFASRATHKVEESSENVREKARETGEVVEETKEKIKEKAKKGKKELSDIANRGKEVIFDAIRYIFWSESMSTLMGVIHLLGFAMAYGICVWVTFIMSHVLADVLTSQQFGLVQSKMYPVYFKAMVSSIGLALFGHLMGQRTRNKADLVQACNLLGSILLVLVNLLFLEPKATKVMFERMKLEKEEGRGRERTSTPTKVTDTVVADTAGPVTTTSTTTSVAATTTTSRPEQNEAKSKLAKLDDRLKKLNSYSSLLNISTLIGLTWHLVYLSQLDRVDNS